MCIRHVKKFFFAFRSLYAKHHIMCTTVISVSYNRLAVYSHAIAAANDLPILLIY